MKITISAIGKGKQSALTELSSSYLKRLPWQVSICEHEEKKPLPEAQLKASEAKLLRSSVPNGARRVVLDERGKLLDSKAFATQFERWQDEGVGQVAFMIGGAAGHNPSVIDEADLVLSLGKMTWPHMLARAMLIEQIYRAYTILTGHPYHKA
jgi:23S rRNA (pseudouridine1915-N3)-methyltransferase